ncbi:MAG: prolipoprotein diacylglyceryl transferase [Dokdonella sp.]|jgi:phosphatidylglycerol:prolipoprotein diacylglycerol transferase|uniref:prolipoprotein diacylglyceryl transferase n=1 Tax=Dokdonella sp. TaxID=2291710 RepID=UPI001B6D6AF1|nr:prolipoprotein diacylglyceryl transferase [Dokdonella sp.]MBK8124490.1 prolipoprotein diacylglyceryl transferase [Dokdonella sp.]MBP6329122.1 prolipoprotein diacylglyceryl transferase [Dokdonella sp.]
MPYLVDIDPIAFSIGPVAVHWYGIMYLIAFAAFWWLGERRRRAGRLPVGPTAFSDLAFYGMIGVILGGRVGYMLFYATPELLADPLSLFRIWEGGMSFHGGLLGVLVAMWYWSRRNGMHFFDVMDFVAPLVPIGLGTGRLGNFIGGELWGRHTDLPWGMIFPRAIDTAGHSIEQLKAMAGAGQLAAEARHPSQLYQMLLEGVLLFCILYFVSMKPKPRYLVSGLFALFYGVFRFGVEFVREPDAQLGYLAWGWLTMGQILSLPLILLGVVLLLASRSAPTLQPRVVADPVPGKKS